ncbi:MAG TPA: class I SAM-dependent methyltransferase [Candidatus Saccharimonadales bacterium]|nr:class I SAM-dependent methyltransferase [Candidatus Saccharimonadales bacterium]
MKDQLAHWNHAHAAGWLNQHSATQTGFAEEVQAGIPAGATILELGCGEGNDSYYLATQGHEITATDFSDVVIGQNKTRWQNDKLTFTEQNISQPLEYADESFDVVYARLSLHYFKAEVTQQIFQEIARVLKAGGLFCFMCKSTEDGIYGQGTEIEKDMYELDGHVRHFFSEPFAQQLLSTAGLQVKKVETGKEQIYDRASAFIKVFATKPARSE